MTDKPSDKHALEWLKAYSTAQDTSALQKSQDGALSRQQSGIPKPSAEARTVPMFAGIPISLAGQLSLPFETARQRVKLVPAIVNPAYAAAIAPNTHVVQCWDVETKMRWSFTEKSLGDAMRTAEKQRKMGPNVRAEVNVAPPPKRRAKTEEGILRREEARDRRSVRESLGYWCPQCGSHMPSTSGTAYCATHGPFDIRGQRKTARRPVSEPSPLSAPKRRAKESDGEGRKKEPPGHVHWVSERWTKAFEYRAKMRRMAGPFHQEKSPDPERIVLHGVHIVSSNGELWMGMPERAKAAIIGKRAKLRKLALQGVQQRGGQFVGWPVRVTLTRVSPKELDDDNLRGALKPIRDGICEALGFRDDKAREGFLDWKYEQRQGGNIKTKTKAAYSEVVITLEVLT